MDLRSQFFFSLLANRVDDSSTESLINFLFVVVDSYLWRVQVSDVLQHFYWVLQSHKVVIHLVEPVPIRDDVL